MGNTIEQWRAAIAGAYSSGGQKTCGTYGSDPAFYIGREEYKCNLTTPAAGWTSHNAPGSWRLSIPYKLAGTTLLMLLLSALCHAEMLVIGGVEINPGPDKVSLEDSTETRLDILAAISSKAEQTCHEVRDVIRAYNLDFTTKQLKTAMNKFAKPQLDKCATWLNLEEPENYTEDAFVNNISRKNLRFASQP